MTHVPHELAEEFDVHKDTIHDLKMNDSHFAKLSDEYHDLNREIHRIETGITPAADDFEKELRRKRVALKDQIFSYLT